MPQVRVDDNVYRRLKEFKQKLHHSSFNETIAYLLDVASNPRSFLETAAYFLEDMRRDVKGLREALEELLKVVRK